MTGSPQGLLLIAHGARDPAWAAPFEAVAQRVRAAAPALAVELSFMELMQPDAPTAGRLLAARGCDRVDVLPLFLGAGGHVRRDLPRLVEALQQAHPATRWALRAAIGEIDSVVAAIAAAAIACTLDSGARDAVDGRAETDDPRPATATLVADGRRAAAE